MDKKVYVNLQRLIDNRYNELEISVDCQKENINYFNGTIEKCGVYVYIKPIKRSHGCISSTLLSASKTITGFKVLAIVLKRKNNKKAEQLFKLLNNEILEKIRINYENENFSEIVSLIKEIATKIS